MISLAFDPGTGECDLVVDADGLLVSSDPIPTAILLSLFQDRRVTASEVPDDVTRGGWWGDAFAASPGDVEGSRLWTLLVTAREDAQALLAARDFALEALAWLTESGLASDLEVSAERLLSGAIGLRVAPTIDGSQRELLFEV